jgi:hypothetical protein
MCNRECDKVSGIVTDTVIHTVNDNIRLAVILVFVNSL